ncbi:Uncharacterised protein [Rothia dentocariosa]|uniref:Uncharacterized protein n=1 Tax=Rothia dentocariosa TaxID=2047 RepID=A0A3S4Y5G7_9MICC|nr:Uncharacterised protein [Rothia dentocariosa]
MLIRDLIPELDDEKFQQLVSNVSNTLSVEKFGAHSGSESIVRLSAPASMTLGRPLSLSCFTHFLQTL